jgi:hypothetical protein
VEEGFTSGSVVINSWAPKASLVDPASLVDARDGMLLVLPHSLDESGLALYRDDNAGIVKTARAAGVDIKFAHPNFNYLSEHGAGEVIANIALGVIGNLTTDVLRHVTYFVRLRLAAALGFPVEAVDDVEGRVILKMARYESPSGHVIEGFEYSGPAGAVVETIKRLAPSSDGPEDREEGNP